MSRADASRLLREDLLAGVAILVANANVDADAGEGSYGAAVEVLCSELGASVSSCALSAGGSDEEVQAAVERALEGALAQGELDMLVIDAAGLFAAIGTEVAGAGDEPAAAGADRATVGERAMLIGSLQACWNITSTVVNTAFLARTPKGAGEGAGERGRRILYIAPPPAAGPHAEAARAGLENLARTLSIEWARHGITPVTIAPGKDTQAGEVATLAAYLASPAGAYFSGCLLDLRGPSRN